MVPNLFKKSELVRTLPEGADITEELAEASFFNNLLLNRKYFRACCLAVIS